MWSCHIHTAPRRTAYTAVGARLSPPGGRARSKRSAVGRCGNIGPMSDTSSPHAERFERLYREHRERVFATCLRLAGDRVRAQEWMQDAFVRIWEQLDTLDENDDVGGWVYTVTVRTVLNVRRSDRRRLRRVALTDDLDGALPEGAVGDVSPHATPTPLRRIAIERALETLRGRARQVFVLHDVEGHATDEVAELLRMAPSTVRVQLARARARMREALAS